MNRNTAPGSALWVPEMCTRCHSAVAGDGAGGTQRTGEPAASAVVESHAASSCKLKHMEAPHLPVSSFLNHHVTFSFPHTPFMQLL